MFLCHESQLVALLSSLGFPAAPPLSTLHTMCFPWWINKGWQRINSKQAAEDERKKHSNFVDEKDPNTVEMEEILNNHL